MLYILLIIIAVGVLLISEAGKKLLGVFAVLFFISGLLFLGLLIIGGVIALLSADKGMRENIFTILGAVMLGLYVIYLFYLLHKKYKQGELTKEIIKNKTLDWIKVSWKKSKIIFIGCSLLIFMLLTVLITSLLDNIF